MVCIAKLITGLSLIITAISFSCVAKPTVTILADYGGENTSVVVANIFGSDEEKEDVNVDNVSAMAKILQYPFKPRFANPGKHISKDFQNPIKHTPPIVLIGTDSFSLRWLQKNKVRLSEIGAKIIVIAANSPDDFKRIASEYRGEVMPMTDSDVLLSQFNIRAYPVLITQDGVYQ